MTSEKYRVVVWSTGGIGSILINSIQRRPNIELVGVWVHSPEKVGKDAGELANGVPIGAGDHRSRRRAHRPKARLRDLCGSRSRTRCAGHPRLLRLLEAGLNVVTTSTTHLVNPHAYEPAEWRDQLAAAAKQGVVAAEPGLVSSLDLPPTIPKGAFCNS